MSKRRLKGATEVLKLIENDPSRGQVFWFLYRQHDEIRASAQGRRIPWRSILATVQALGLMNADGNPVTKTAALKLTWSRVCDLKRREAEVKPQRAAAQRRPTNDPPPVVARTMAPALPRLSTNPAPLQIVPVPRAMIEEEARRAAERRPDLFPGGPDVMRYKLLKGRRGV